MDIKPEDFPLYTLLVGLNQRGIDKLVGEMEAAQKGDAADKHRLAFSLFSIAYLPESALLIDGFNNAVKAATIKRCIEVLDELAAGGYEPSGELVAVLKSAPGLKAPQP